MAVFLCVIFFYLYVHEQPEVVGDRLKTYSSVTQPLIEHYTARGILKTFTVGVCSRGSKIVWDKHMRTICPSHCR